MSDYESEKPVVSANDSLSTMKHVFKQMTRPRSDSVGRRSQMKSPRAKKHSEILITRELIAPLVSFLNVWSMEINELIANVEFVKKARLLKSEECDIIIGQRCEIVIVLEKIVQFCKKDFLGAEVSGFFHILVNMVVDQAKNNRDAIDIAEENEKLPIYITQTKEFKPISSILARLDSKMSQLHNQIVNLYHNTSNSILLKMKQLCSNGVKKYIKTKYQSIRIYTKDIYTFAPSTGEKLLTNDFYCHHKKNKRQSCNIREKDGMIYIFTTGSTEQLVSSYLVQDLRYVEWDYKVCKGFILEIFCSGVVTDAPIKATFICESDIQEAKSKLIELKIQLIGSKDIVIANFMKKMTKTLVQKKSERFTLKAIIAKSGKEKAQAMVRHAQMEEKFDSVMIKNEELRSELNKLKNKLNKWSKEGITPELGAKVLEYYAAENRKLQTKVQKIEGRVRKLTKDVAIDMTMEVAALRRLLQQKKREYKIRERNYKRNISELRKSLDDRTAQYQHTLTQLSLYKKSK